MSQIPDASVVPSKGQAGADPYSIPLDKIDMSDSELFETNTHWGYFERLRKEDPVHYCAASDFGPFWSVTRYHDIVHVEKNPEIFSSARSISVVDPFPTFRSRQDSSRWTGRSTMPIARWCSPSHRRATCGCSSP
jgi:cytochrome P450